MWIFYWLESPTSLELKAYDLQVIKINASLVVGTSMCIGNIIMTWWDRPFFDYIMPFGLCCDESTSAQNQVFGLTITTGSSFDKILSSRRPSWWIRYHLTEQPWVYEKNKTISISDSYFCIWLFLVVNKCIH